MRLWEMSAEEIFQTGLKGLLPLIPFTREGLEHEIIEQAITRLGPIKDNQSKALLSTLFGFGALVYIKPSDKDWLSRRVAMAKDMLRDSWLVQDFLEEGRQEGRQKGRQEGRQEGKLDILKDVVERRFPALLSVFEEKRSQITAMQNLDSFVLDFICTTNEQQALQLLQQINKQ